MTRKILGWIAVVTVGVMLSACGGGGDDSGTAVPTLQSIAVTPADPHVPVSRTSQLTATGTFTDGHTENLSSSVTWSSGATSVATVSAGGLATAVAAGTSTVTAAQSGKSAQTTLTVTTVQSLTLSSAGEAPVAVGDTRQFTASAVYSDGATESVTSSATWSSQLTSVATVNVSGLATAVALGSSVVTATLGGKSAAATLVVQKATGTNIIVTPVNNEKVGSLFTVRVVPILANEVSSVSAAVEGISAMLTFQTGCGPCWAGNLNISSLPRGPHTLLVTVKDAAGGQVVVTQTIVLDQPPSIQITRPRDFGVSLGTLAIKAACMDDDPAGCASIIAKLCFDGAVNRTCDTQALAQGTGNIDTTATLNLGNDFTRRRVRFDATDRSGQVTTVFVPIYIESNAHLHITEEVPGILLDVDATRLLYRAPDSTQMILRDRSTETDTVIYSSPSKLVTGNAFLTPSGAAFAAESSPADSTAYSWEGALINLGGLNPASSLGANGNWIIWSNGDTLKRRDVAAQATVTVSTSAVNGGAVVGTNGASAFLDLPVPGVSLYKTDGTTVSLAADGRGPLATDGTATVYGRDLACPAPCNTPTHSVILNISGSETDLGAQDEFGVSRVVSGSVAYMKLGPTGISQVWLRDPSGTQTQIITANASSTLEALAANGSVTLRRSGLRYLVPDGGSEIEIGHDLNSVSENTLFIDNDAFILLGNALIAVE